MNELLIKIINDIPEKSFDLIGRLLPGIIFLILLYWSCSLYNVQINNIWDFKFTDIDALKILIFLIVAYPIGMSFNVVTNWMLDLIVLIVNCIYDKSIFMTSIQICLRRDEILNKNNGDKLASLILKILGEQAITMSLFGISIAYTLVFLLAKKNEIITNNIGILFLISSIILFISSLVLRYHLTKRIEERMLFSKLNIGKNTKGK